MWTYAPLLLRVRVGALQPCSGSMLAFLGCSATAQFGVFWTVQWSRCLACSCTALAMHPTTITICKQQVYPPWDCHPPCATGCIATDYAYNVNPILSSSGSSWSAIRCPKVVCWKHCCSISPIFAPMSFAVASTVLTADRTAIAVELQDTAAAVASTSAAPAPPPAAVYKTVKQLRLRSAAAYLPHPEKESYGGEDAHFVSNVSGGAIGVADGEQRVCWPCCSLVAAGNLSWEGVSRRGGGHVGCRGFLLPVAAELKLSL